MNPEIKSMQIPEELQFFRRPWWDPVPIWFLSHLDDKAIFELAKLQMESDRAMLDAQLRMNETAQKIINEMRR